MDILHFDLLGSLGGDPQVVVRLRLISDPQMLRTSRLLQNWFVLGVELDCWLLLLDWRYVAEGHDFVRLLDSSGRC